LVNVTAQEVRDRINVSETQCPDDVVTVFIGDAAETIEIETGLAVDPTACTDIEAVAIRNLAAIYCACRITGGYASGLSFKVGDIAVNESSSSSSLGAGNLQFLLDQAVKVIEKLKGPQFRAVNA
jgi:hypothetical protein